MCFQFATKQISPFHFIHLFSISTLAHQTQPPPVRRHSTKYLLYTHILFVPAAAKTCSKQNICRTRDSKQIRKQKRETKKKNVSQFVNVQMFLYSKFSGWPRFNIPAAHARIAFPSLQCVPFPCPYCSFFDFYFAFAWIRKRSTTFKRVCVCVCMRTAREIKFRYNPFQCDTFIESVSCIRFFPFAIHCACVCECEWVSAGWSLLLLLIRFHFIFWSRFWLTNFCDFRSTFYTRRTEHVDWDGPRARATG